MDRGRVYQCLTCDYKGERKAVLKHFKTKHIQPAERQYHCTLCKFSTDDKNMLKRHANFYKPHALQKEVMVAAGTYLGHDDVYIKENEHPRVISEEKDIKRWEAAESALYWESRRKPSSYTPASTDTVAQLPTTISAAPTVVASTITTPVDNVRVVQDENLLDLLLYGAEEDDDIFQMPEPLRSPLCQVPRPTLPDITLPVVDEHLVPPSSFPDSLSLTTMEKLLAVGKQMCDHLNRIEKLLVRNHDQMEKVEIAVRRSYSHSVTPSHSFTRQRQPFNRYRPYNRYSRTDNSPRRPSTPRKRKFIPEKSVSPVKKMKSTVRKNSK